METVLLKVSEVADLLSIEASTLTKWRSVFGIHQQPLPFVKIGRSVRYKRTDVLQYIDKNTVGGINEVTKAQRS
jgi:excisionase family DNA binding protein